MKVKDYISITVVAVLIIMGYVTIKAISTKNNKVNNNQNSLNTTSNSTNSTNSGNSTGTDNNQNDINTGTNGNQYSLSDVASHNSRSNCWVIMTSNNTSQVYDVTEYVSNPNKHPGASVINYLAGVEH